MGDAPVVNPEMSAWAIAKLVFISANVSAKRVWALALGAIPAYVVRLALLG